MIVTVLDVQCMTVVALKRPMQNWVSNRFLFMRMYCQTRKLRNSMVIQKLVEVRYVQSHFIRVYALRDIIFRNTVTSL
jgi:hypothetical protein